MAVDNRALTVWVFYMLTLLFSDIVKDNNCPLSTCQLLNAEWSR